MTARSGYWQIRWPVRLSPTETNIRAWNSQGLDKGKGRLPEFRLYRRIPEITSKLGLCLDVYTMCEPTEEGAGQALRAEHFSPLLERKVGSDQR